MPYANVLLDHAVPVSTVTVNRPSVLNALDETTLAELEDAFATLARAVGVRCVILAGAGDKAFVAGADIAAMAKLGPEEARGFAERGHRLCALMETLPAPIVAAVGGFALGGGLELALACDFVVASSNAKLGLPEVGLGVIPGFGGAQRLARRIGIAKARELVYTGDPLSADDALRIGLVSAVVPPHQLLPSVRALAGRIAERAPLAVAAAKRALREGGDAPLSQALALERELFAALFASADQAEGMRAFLEKRPPSFQGK